MTSTRHSAARAASDFKAGGVEVPALESVKHEVRIYVAKHPFTIRLPKLASGRVLFQSHGVDSKAIAKSRFEAPLVSLDQIEFEGRFTDLLRIPGLPTKKTTRKQPSAPKPIPVKRKPAKPATKQKR